jgi:hypothetical protein
MDRGNGGAGEGEAGGVGLPSAGRLGAALFAARAVIAVTALRERWLSLKLQRGGQRGVSKMSYHQAARIGFRAHWLAIELAFYLLALLTLGAQFACLLTSFPK